MPDRYYTRRFLNRRGHHAGAYVLAIVENPATRTEDRTWTDVELTIADCGRQISLDFSADPGELANSLDKIDVLADTLARFRETLEAEGRLAAERGDRLKAKKKAVISSAPATRG